MDGYSLLLFGHIAFAIVWLGSGVLLHALAIRFDRANDDVALEKLLDGVAVLGQRLFMPSALLVVAFGVALTIDGPWSFGMLWIVLGLAGFVLTFLTGLLWLGPQSERIAGLIERHGGMSAEARSLTQRMLLVARIDTVVLFLIVFAMTMKPTGQDVATLVLMGAILAAAAGFLAWRARAIVIPATEAAPETTPVA